MTRTFYSRQDKRIFMGSVNPEHIADAISEEIAQELVDILNSSIRY